jgi:ATP-dependent RNA helicase DDX35
MNAVVFERTDYNPLAPEADPGTHVYRLVRPLGGGLTSSSTTAANPSGDKRRRLAVDAGSDGSSPGLVRMRIHAGSVLGRCRPEWAVFTSVQQSDAGWFEMQGVTAIQQSWLLQAAPHYYQEHR